jgi:muconate cycloisomerase
MDAVRGIAKLEAGGIDLIEQPVKAEQPRRAGAPGARFDVAIMADEALHGPDDAWRWPQMRPTCSP